MFTKKHYEKIGKVIACEIKDLQIDTCKASIIINNWIDVFMDDNDRFKPDFFADYVKKNLKIIDYNIFKVK